MANIIEGRVMQKKDTEANWLVNPLPLLSGEQAFVVTTTGQPINFKIGDGVRTFAQLPYWIKYDQAAWVSITGTVLPSQPAGTVKYSLLGAGTYTQTTGGSIVIPAGNMSTVTWNGTNWVKGDNIPIPINSISDWLAIPYASGAQVYYAGNIWISNAAAVAGDVPSVSTKWVKKINAGAQDWTAKAYQSGEQVFYAGNLYQSNAATLVTDIPGVSTKWVEKINGDNSLLGCYLNNNNGAPLPVFSKPSAQVVTITMPASAMDLYGSNGVKIVTAPADTVSATYTLVTNQILYWNIELNTFVVAYLGVARTKKSVLLASNRNGIIIEGLFRDSFNAYYYNLDLINYWVDSGLNEPIIFTKENSTSTTIKAKLASTPLYLYNTRGALMRTSQDVQKNEEFILNSWSVLVWDLEVNEIKVLPSTGSLPLNAVVLLYNKVNYAYGLFAEKYYEYINGTVLFQNYIDIAGNSTFTFEKIKNITNITVKLPKEKLYLFSRKGISLYISKDEQLGQVFDLPQGSILVWNLDANNIEVIQRVAPRDIRYILLLDNKNGVPLNGWAKPIFDKWWTKRESQLTFVNPLTSLSRYKTKVSALVGQSLAIIGKEMWAVSASSDDNVGFSPIRRFDIDTWIEKAELTHNLGHAASSSYNLETDVLMVGNGSGSKTNYPRLDFVKNVSSRLGDATSVIDINSSDVLSINLRTDVKTIGGTGLIGCFSDDKRFVYLMTEPGNRQQANVFYCSLGMGTDDFSDKTVEQNDITLWGTFQSGKTANEFNGTLKVLGVYDGPLLGIYQGCTYKDGYLWLAEGYGQARVHKIKVMRDFTFKSVDVIDLTPYTSAGASVNSEPEGVIIDECYLYSIVIHNPNGIVAVPIYNKQKGIGVTGTKVMFDFKMVGTPTIELSPTNNVTDLYVSQQDSVGFTVTSASGGSGTFKWTCGV